MTAYALAPHLVPRIDPPLTIARLAHRLEAWARARLRAHPKLTLQPQDLSQEVLTRLFASYGGDALLAHPPRVVIALARRTLDNLVVDEARRTRPTVGAEALVQVADRAPPPDEALTRAHDLARLERSLASLGVQERAFLISVMRLDSVPAAQREVGWPSASPYYHLARLLRILRDSLEVGH